MAYYSIQYSPKIFSCKAMAVQEGVNDLARECQYNCNTEQKIGFRIITRDGMIIQTKEEISTVLSEMSIPEELLSSKQIDMSVMMHS